ncbi:hypothetical protein D3C72_2089230 [compost metagenome]
MSATHTSPITARSCRPSATVGCGRHAKNANHAGNSSSQPSSIADQPLGSGQRLASQHGASSSHTSSDSAISAAGATKPCSHRPAATMVDTAR